MTDYESKNLMWIYQQATGKIMDPGGVVVGYGYSGRGVYKNDPEAQSRHDEGPIPEGYYSIGDPHDTITHGPFVLPLTPDPLNKMFGRSGFLIHGDSIIHPGTASHGCIIANRHIREDIAKSEVKLLGVVSGIFTIKRDLDVEETQV
jgi:hypothetical protein